MMFSLNHKNVESAFLNLAQVLQVTRQVRGLCEIEDFAVYSYDKAKRSCCFVASNPALEHNLINKDYLQYDESFDLSEKPTRTFMWWEDSFNEEKKDLLIKEKLVDFGYSAGFTLSKQQYEGRLVKYSFASKSLRPNIRLYYQKNQEQLLTVGDFMYNKLIPILDHLHAGAKAPVKKDFLYLVEKYVIE